MHNLTGAFVICEEESVVLPQRAAKSTTKLITNEDRFLWRVCERIGGRCEGSDGVKDRVAKIVVGLAVKLIGAAADTYVDDRACRTTIFGTIVVSLDAELRD